MAITRRQALVQIAKGATAAGAFAALSPVAAHAEEAERLSPERVGLLYDATLCVGCKDCMVGCWNANNLRPDPGVGSEPTEARDLNNKTKNIIKYFRSKDGGMHSFLKQQCMQCNDPACVNACMFHGLTKDEITGVVSWNGKKCVGCRYCEVACPFHVPTFRWAGYNPEIVKCELCQHRTKHGELPGCVSICPTKAVIYGKTEDLLQEAHKRIAEHPGKYHQDRVYGEHDAGGTQSLILAAVPYEDLTLTIDEKDASVPSRLKYQHIIYKGFIAPAIAFVAMAGIIFKNFRHVKHEVAEEQKKTGLRGQL